MLLRHHLRTPRGRIVAGQTCLVLGILIGRFGPRLAFVREGTFEAGFLDGLSLSFLILSVPLNLLGLWEYRKRKREEAGR